MTNSLEQWLLFETYRETLKARYRDSVVAYYAARRMYATVRATLLALLTKRGTP